MQILEVSQLNEYLRLRFEEDEFLGNVLVRGEVSNYKLYPSGHHYFSIKDAGGSLRCVMFKGNAFRLRFHPENGMKVIAGGRVSVFPRDGVYQLYCTELTPDGVGDLHVAFEQLKITLEREGLFDRSRKLALPHFPHTIALITSPAGAALHDMLRILRKRYPLCEVKLLGVRVQGTEAPAEIAGAIRYANRYRVADLIITGRGGGSIEDLWAFNDERVARAIADSQIPVISAVGHEPDFSISDFVADLRAATPSNAAELAVPDQAELRAALAQTNGRLCTLVSRILKQDRLMLEKLRDRPCMKSPVHYIDDRRQQLDRMQERLSAAADRCVRLKRQRFTGLTAKLDAMSPLKVLSRGYSFAQDAQDRPVTSVRRLLPGDRLTIHFADGSAAAQIQEVSDETGFHHL